MLIVGSKARLSTSTFDSSVNFRLLCGIRLYIPTEYSSGAGNILARRIITKCASMRMKEIQVLYENQKSVGVEKSNT